MKENIYFPQNIIYGLFFFRRVLYIGTSLYGTLDHLSFSQRMKTGATRIRCDSLPASAYSSLAMLWSRREPEETLLLEETSSDSMKLSCNLPP
jgi:hypothetical protein